MIFEGVRSPIGFVIVVGLLASSFASQIGNVPSYARPGAIANFSEFGGFVAFFGGVYGNVSFAVVQVFQNGSMSIRVQANLSQSGEGPPETLERNFTDSIMSPRQFPAIPPANLIRSDLAYGDTPLSFKGNETISVPAGTFDTAAFSGQSPGGNITYFWFDRASGLAIQVERGGAVLQLVTSNIAVPVSAQSSGEAFLPPILLVVVLWVAAGGFFFWVIRKARKGGNRDGEQNQSEPRSG